MQPKKAVASKFDRQTDRRSYAQRKEMYEKCLRMDGKPQVPKPKAIFHGSCKPPEDVRIRVIRLFNRHANCSSAALLLRTKSLSSCARISKRPSTKKRRRLRMPSRLRQSSRPVLYRKM